MSNDDDARFNENVAALGNMFAAKDREILDRDRRISDLQAKYSTELAASDAQRARIAEREREIAIHIEALNAANRRIAELEAQLKAANETIAQLHRNYGVPV